ncbi:arylformamidase [Entomophthora muscae]|uniref:Arylformamidase n=1 Tax=Entomophthora muscae TaxID=34485 RepID=A0ACC2REX3_9FUNG|nr:arylformamidase [Entomophthora muscae]
MSSNKDQPLDLSNFVSQRVANLQDDVWSIFSKVSTQFQTINLGQGFMGFPAPDFVKKALVEATMNDINQYAPVRGLPRLCNALSNNYSPLFKRQLDPNTNILITTGANEGIFSVFAAFIKDGDEAIFIEPYFDQYKPNLEMNGGVPIYCPLRKDESISFSSKVSSSVWKLDTAEMESKITSKTKIIVLNTPYNPVGKIFTEEELLSIGKVAEKHNLIILSDEVYDRLYFAPATHTRIAALENFWRRTITVGSAGKSFGVTGWRVGWLIGPENLIKYTMGAHCRICFCTSSTMQDAVANAFEQSETNGFFETQIQEYDERRKYLMDSFDDIGLSYVIPDGAYFILVNTEKIHPSAESWEDCPDFIKERGFNYQMCYWLAKNIGVTAIPCSEFYSADNSSIADSLIRFAFCKPIEVLKQAVERMQKLKPLIQ